MGKAYFEISTAVLADVLNLPEGTEIALVEQTAIQAFNGWVRLYVRHPDLPSPLEGELTQRATPAFRRVTSSAVEFEDWGLE